MDFVPKRGVKISNCMDSNNYFSINNLSIVLICFIVSDWRGRGEVLGVPFISFLAPGLIAMQVIQQSFSHSSSSFMIGKIQGNIVDLLYAPLSATEVTLAVILASVTRSFMIAIISFVTFFFIIDIQIQICFI